MTRTAEIQIEMELRRDDESRPQDYLFQDQDPDYQQQDRERLSAWERGEWHFVGVRAKASIKIPFGTNPSCWICSELRTPGLWGIESDADPQYLREVFHQERGILIEMLNDIKTGEIRA